MTVKFNVPKKASSVNCEVPKNNGNHQKIDYNQSSHSVEWQIQKMPGDVEYEGIAKVTLPSATSSQAQKEIGPVSLSFEIPMFCISGMQIKSLKTIQGNGDFNKWVRYITKSSSYVCRI